MENFRYVFEIVCAVLMVSHLPFYWREHKPIPLWVRCVWLYFLVHAIFTSLLPHWTPDGIHPNLALQIQKNAAQITLMLTLYLPVVCRFSREARRWFLNCFALAVVLDFCFMSFTGWGILFTWTSFETSMAALVLPFLYFAEWKGSTFLALVLWGFIIVHRGSTGILAGAAGLMVFGFWFRQWHLALVQLILVPVALLIHRPAPFSGGRFQMWKAYLLWWADHAQALVGCGTGSAEWVLPFLPWKPDAWSAFQTMNLMHNDFLQILFDTGLIGLLGCLSVAGWLLWNLRAKPRYLACAVSYLVVMSTYFPLHYAFGQIILCILIAEAL